ncbi:hypothetical protein [Jiangella alkaliphila]|uniref:2-keto-4-pentenoate hydratase n=1 Tax=Jiangella alkaliphila TaxID=419479 RepID=A0A1H2LGD7_9ACTN|nr:hypothetical protein [Jiangella alkaliphila]SDU79688.1 2-keto-4-pentenoate hydratase [Jiangella alkaliphila]
MAESNPKLLRALEAQLAVRQAALDSGAMRIGWKLGLGDRERIGGGPVVGYLTSLTVLPSGSRCSVAAYAVPRADVEIAVRFKRAVDPDGGLDEVRAAAGSFTVALELCDLGGSDDPAAILAANLFHRAVLFGPWTPGFPRRAAHAGATIDGAVLAQGRARRDLDHLLLCAARLLADLGEGFRTGDVVIMGSIVEVAVHNGQQVSARIDGCGSVHVDLA